MLEEIKALLPLLNDITGGAMWAIVAFFGLKYAEMFLITGIVVYVVSRGHKLIMLGLGEGNHQQIVSTYQFDDKKLGINVYFGKKAFQDLLVEIGIDTSGSIDAIDVRKAIETLKAARSK